ncbi:MAG UNVERIFIED_CONTAM: hypothetical protein LVR18_22385 [Planctomycetaceae bacterium]
MEEPQAATYNWLHTVGDRWRKILKVGQRMLVCDIGGGTTDLTLVEATEEQGGLVLRRIAVGPHLLVGGDNMDAALAHAAAGLFQDKGVSLDPWQSISLWHACRQAKESLLSSSSARDAETISVPGRGSRLIGGLVSVSLPRALAQELLINGFFPRQRSRIDRRNPARRVSARLGFHGKATPRLRDTSPHSCSRLPTERHRAVCFSTAASFAVQRSEHGCWNSCSNGILTSRRKRSKGATILTSPLPAVPASMAGRRQHGGVRIRGGAPRSYYVGIETAGLAIPGIGRPLKALCVVPREWKKAPPPTFPVKPLDLLWVNLRVFVFQFVGSPR